VAVGAAKGSLIGGIFMTFIVLAGIFLPSTHASPWVRVIVISVAALSGGAIGALFGGIARLALNHPVRSTPRLLFAVASGSVIFVYLGWALEFFSTSNWPGLAAAGGVRGRHERCYPPTTPSDMGYWTPLQPPTMKEVSPTIAAPG